MIITHDSYINHYSGRSTMVNKQRLAQFMMNFNNLVQFLQPLHQVIYMEVVYIIQSRLNKPELVTRFG